MGDCSLHEIGDDRVRVAARDVFGFASLRPGQAEVITDVLAGRPTVAVMPTGAGKSLCYQLPAVLLSEDRGVTVVVSPLIALMKDQVDSLAARGVAAAALTSASSGSEQAHTLQRLRSGALALLYIAPERFRSLRFTEALSAVQDRIALLAIDEAHCISEWGHEFRPDYRRLGEAIGRLRPPRLVALTATATPEVRQDIAEQLGFDAARLHVHGFDRPNLVYHVERAGGPADKASRLVDRVRAAPGPALVYVATRKNAERYAAALATGGLRAGVYHAGLDDDARARAQDAFMAGATDVVVATNAFGMGVDKSDIRLVVHADLARSPEAYYQESGRGGRDGDQTRCVLLFNHGDVRLHEFMIDASYPGAEVLRGVWRLVGKQPELDCRPERLAARLEVEAHPRAVETAIRILMRHGLLRDDGGAVRAVRPDPSEGYPALDVNALQRREQVERAKLRKMVEYAYHPRCRRQFLLEYFGDADWRTRADTCGACDNCLGGGEAQTLTEEQGRHVRGLLAVVARLSGRFGRRRLAAVANATDDDPRMAEVPERGVLRGQTTRYLIDLLRSVEGAGLVDVSRGDYPTISITSRGRRVVDGAASAQQIGVMLPEDRAGRKRTVRGTPVRRRGVVDESGDIDPALLDRLRQWRTDKATEQSLPAYAIFSNRTLEALARTRPSSQSELAQVHGIGPSRLEAYGDDILQAIAGGEAIG